MAFLIYDNKSLRIDTSNLLLDEKHLIEILWTLLEKHGYDFDCASTGVSPGPDLGYFELAVRYWKAALSIYFAGFSKAFIEASVEFLEPWLFNSRHAIELYLKGLLLYVEWYQQLHENSLESGFRTQVAKISNIHNLFDLYTDYKDKLISVLSNWESDHICEPPELDELILTKRGEDILTEISEADPTSFRFRYPSLFYRHEKAKGSHRIQQIQFERNKERLFTITGLPREAGIDFGHVKVMNTIHELFKSLSDIGNHHDSVYSYVDDLQSFAHEW